MELFILRHPEVSNPLHLCYGQFEIPLKEISNPSLLDLKNHIQFLKLDAIFCSFSYRTNLLAEKLNLKLIQKDSRLNELHFGKWEGKPWTEISGKDLDAWMYNYYFKASPEGESYSDLFYRIDSFLEEYIFPIAFSDQKVLLISHSGPIQCLLARFLNINPYKIISWKIPYSKIWKIELGKNKRPIVYPPK